MPGPLRLKGRGASPGLAHGPAYVAMNESIPAAAALPSGRDAELLRAAVDTAIEHLQVLAAQADPESAAILEFQIEMLCDPALVEPGFERIRMGASASFAWVAALDDYIRAFDEADDEHIRARSSDMLDIKNQVLRILYGEPPPDFPSGSIFVGKDVAPSLFLAHDWSHGGGIALFEGSAASHVAMLARSRTVPMVVGLERAPIENGIELLIDGDEGVVEAGKSVVRHRPEAGYRAGHGIVLPAVSDDDREARTADGVAVTLQVNVDHPSELADLSPSAVDGIGLFRTEYLMASPAHLTDEERQFRIYAETLGWAAGKPVTIRLLDFGADKPLPGNAVDPASYLGLRGVRLLLAQPDMLRVQVRALLRAAPAGQLRVLLPMVTSPLELEVVHAIFAEEAGRLAARNIAHLLPPLGIMLEVPAAALMPERFEDAAFFSFGTNDLGQYLSASARDNAAVSDLYAASAPALLRFLKQTVPVAQATQKPVGICGDIAGDPQYLPDLLACGFRDFSMPSARIALVRRALSGLNADGSKAGD